MTTSGCRGFIVAAAVVAMMACQASSSRGAASADPVVSAPPQTGTQGRSPKLIPDPPPKELSIANISALESLREDGMHDESNDALSALQNPTEAMHNFPVDRRQQINWVQTLDQGLIEPRASLDGKGEMLVMDMDILFTNTKDMPYVRFPHLQHTRWLDCGNCHPKIFVPRRGANPVSMNKVLRGEYCGVCHDKVAFSLFICERCHSVPHEGSGKWW